MFSIIIPSYNRSDEIPYLLESLLHQTVHNFEIIIVDDCSTTPVELKQFYPFPVNVIRNEQNQGAAESRNIGAKNAKNAWLLFLDDDDRFATPKCEILVGVITENPQINFIYHPAECVMVNEHFSYFTKPYKNENDLTLLNLLKANKIGGMPMIAIKKDFYFALGGLSTELHALEDYDFVLKAVSNAAFSPKYIDKALTKCAFHTQRNSVSTHTTHTEKAIHLIEKQYIRTQEEDKAFKFNTLYMLSYPYIMNLSRKAGFYYLKMATQSKNIKYAIIALMIFISPKLALNMKRFI